jgi:hypothetical protein
MFQKVACRLPWEYQMRIHSSGARPAACEPLPAAAHRVDKLAKPAGLLRAVISDTGNRKSDAVYIALWDSTTSDRGWGLVGAPVPFGFSRLTDIMMGDLMNARPPMDSESEAGTYRDKVSEYVVLVVSKIIRENPGKIKAGFLTVKDFILLYKPVEALRGESSDKLEEAIQWLRLQIPEEQWAKMGSMAIHLDALEGLMVDAGYMLGESADARWRPLAAAELAECWRLMFDGRRLGIDRSARLFATVRTEPSASPAALASARALLDKFSTGDIRDHTVGVWLTATALVLNLPRSSLTEIVLTEAVVDMLRHHARLLLGSAHDRSMPQMKVLSDNPWVLGELAAEALGTPPGLALATRLHSALQILGHNARRLDIFLEMEESMLPRNQGKALIALLDEFVPQPLPEGADNDFSLLLPITPPAESDAEVKAQAVLLPPGKPRARPGRKQAAAAAQPTAISAKASGPQAARMPLRPHAQPGSKLPQPAMHHHPANKGLTKADKNARAEKHKAVMAGLIDPYARWTPELREQLIAARQQARLLRNTGSTQVIGGKLVRPPTP